jgi:hypothetical protein
LLAVVDCDNQVELRDVESDYLERDAGELYNAAPEARSVLNIERSDETRAKIRAALIGRKRSPETRARISEAQRKRAASTRNLAPLLASRRGVTLTPEHRAKIGEANRRRVLSNESRMRMRLAQLRARAVDPTRWARAGRVRGFRHSPETKQRISDALRGKPKSTAAVLKQAAALSGRPNGALLLSPDGILHRVLNASAFARQHGLNQQSVSAVILGKRRVHKGWTLASADEVTTGR